jgi:TRAP-type mannitol/chloroaromatic compound transport system permease small subunit
MKNAISCLERTAAVLEALNRRVGEIAAWLTLATVLVCFATVYLRYAMGVGLIWLQESYLWTHALVIMLGSGYALLNGGFVRVDMLHQHMSERQKAVVEIVGTLAFLTPFVVMLMTSGWSFFLSSWRMGERSAYEGGLPALYVLKGMLVVFAILLAIQGLAMIVRAVLTLASGSAASTRGVDGSAG